MTRPKDNNKVLISLSFSSFYSFHCRHLRNVLRQEESSFLGLFRENNNVVVFPFPFHTFIPLVNLWLTRLQGQFPILRTRRCPNPYPLIRPSKKSLAIGRGRILIPGCIWFLLCQLFISLLNLSGQERGESIQFFLLIHSYFKKILILSHVHLGHPRGLFSADLLIKIWKDFYFFTFWFH